MRVCCRGLITVFLSMCWGCTTALASPPISLQPYGSEKDSRGNIEEYLYLALNSAGIPGRVYYQGPCRGGEALHLPRLSIRPPPRGETGLAAVKEIFRNNSDVDVTEDQTGMVRVIIGKVPATILKTKINHLALTPFEQYNHNLAIGAIENSDEVKSAMRLHHLKLQTVPVVEQFVQPAPSLRHLSPFIEGATMEQALDSVAKIFSGVVLYSVCSGSRMINIEFMGGIYYYHGRTPP